jgi:hypothetical protein
MFRLARLAALALVACVFAASAAAQQLRLPGGIAQAVAATQAAQTAYAFDLDIDTAKQAWRAHFDPGAQPRLTLRSPRREALNGDERRAFDRMAAEMEGISWCAGEGMTRIADARLLREDAETATYAFQPTRESIRGAQARRYADRLRGEVTVSKADPDFTHLRIFTPAAFSPAPLVQVDSFVVDIACAPAPNGRRYAAETVTQVRGSALGQAFNERSVQRASNLRAAP